MTPHELDPDPVRTILLEISELALAAPSGGPVCEGMRRFASALDDAHGDKSAREAVLNNILKMYRGGMGSFQDYVVQDAKGVLPEHDAFDRLRSRLYDVVKAELS
ncbi:hypothetical protein M2302_003084 [Micromonospora sp. A200]|uniref:DUF6966 domain-containing protein n=1 Tax=Micromonospora sp. A200 TaxID=2940568 RepID=UPI002474B59C|nr:hypothetical protein [Micromonospora sp. A200]MDH6462899.1 hypothetical protein [Micromonospora sp. A200]